MSKTLYNGDKFQIMMSGHMESEISSENLDAVKLFHVDMEKSGVLQKVKSVPVPMSDGYHNFNIGCWEKHKLCIEDFEGVVDPSMIV